jgi:YfiH family protein
MAVRADGRPSVTHYRVVRRFRAHTLVRVTLETGRTHQIRVHLAHAGYPIVGDPVYGGRRRLPPGATAALAAALQGFPRQALHAVRLQLGHPVSGKLLQWEAPLPQDLQELLAALAADGRAPVEAPCLRPEWPVPARVHAAFTLRGGGVSAAPFDTLNVGAHVGDSPPTVAENRRRVRRLLALPAEPLWLEQVHGTGVFDPDAAAAGVPPHADAVIARSPGRVAVIQVADCLPVLLATADGVAVAAAHAGWRGLAAGVLEATIAALGGDASRLLAWLGPAIGPRHFEVGTEVHRAFTQQDPPRRGPRRQCPGRWQCDLRSSPGSDSPGPALRRCSAAAGARTRIR